MRLTHSDHPHGNLVQEDRKAFSLYHLTRDFTRDFVPEHQVSCAPDGETNYECDDVRLIDHSVEIFRTGHISRDRRNYGMSRKLVMNNGSRRQGSGIENEEGKLRTPAIIIPKLRGSLARLGPIEVATG